MTTSEEIDETDLPRPVAIAWGLQETPQRGPARGLTHKEIVAAAIKIADEHGLAAVTMQSVAKSLGFTTMSLYRYVRSKDDLLRLMQDAVLQVPRAEELPQTWPEGLYAWARLLRQAYRDSPWVLEITRDQTSVLMPNSMRAADLGLSVMDQLHLTEDQKITAIMLLSQQVASMVSLERSLAEEGNVVVTSKGMAAISTVLTQEEFPRLASLIAADGYVTAGENIESAEQRSSDPADPEEPAGQVDHEFELALQLVALGLEALAQQATDKTPR